MTQSNMIKTENLENDFGELSTKTKQLGWSDEKENPSAWIEETDCCESQGDQFAWRKHVIMGMSEGIFFEKKKSSWRVLCGLLLSLGKGLRLTNRQSRRSVVVS